MITDARCASNYTRAHGPISYSPEHKSLVEIGFEISAHEKKIVTVSSRWAHCDHGGHGSGPNDPGSVVGEVTAQSRRGHSSVMARSQLNHSILSMITAQSRLGHSSITAQVMAQSWLAVTILVTASSRWVHCELTVSSHGGQFFFLIGVSN